MYNYNTTYTYTIPSNITTSSFVVEWNKIADTQPMTLWPVTQTTNTYEVTNLHDIVAIKDYTPFDRDYRSFIETLSKSMLHTTLTTDEIIEKWNEWNALTKAIENDANCDTTEEDNDSFEDFILGRY